MSDNKATDLRPPFFLIEESVVDDYNLHPLAGWLYIVIVRHINRKRNDAFPSVARLAKLANMSKASVIRYTKTLEAAGLISVTREKDDAGESLVNHYKLLTATGVVSDSNKGISTGDVVSLSNHPGITQQLRVVSDVVHNQKNTNQMKEPEEGNNAPPRTHLSPALSFAIDDAADQVYQTVDNHTGAMMQADVFIRVFEGACKARNAPQTVPRTRNNRRVAAQWYIDGYTEDEIRRAVDTLFEMGKPVSFAFLGEKLAFARNGFRPATVKGSFAAAPANGKPMPASTSAGVNVEEIRRLVQEKKRLKQEAK